MKDNFYNENDLLKVAKRINNSRRKYLLVNPMQAKHMPASPKAAYDMMRALGGKIKEAYGGHGVLVIGFAETATAIGAVVAGCLGDHCGYIHTTREKLTGCDNYYTFLEEHSHAVDQSLCAENFMTLLAGVDTVILVDDEISTGQTILNIISELHAKIPGSGEMKFVAASIINRMNEDDKRRFASKGIGIVALLPIDHDCYDKSLDAVKVLPAAICDRPHGMGQEAMTCGRQRIAVAGAERHGMRPEAGTKGIELETMPEIVSVGGKQDPRTGVCIGAYHESCVNLGKKIIGMAGLERLSGKKALILGTEECMYPAIVTGMMIEHERGDIDVKCHATSRSPIAVSSDDGYPIFEGYRLKSFYDPDRPVYIYNLGYYDLVVLITDAEPGAEAAHAGLAGGASIASIVRALSYHGYGSLLCIRWMA